MQLQHVALVVVLLSVCFQAAAGVCALRLIPVSGRKLAWTLIALAALGMAARRSIALIRFGSGPSVTPLDFEYEALGLLISLLMFFGILGIGPIFKSIAEMTDKLRLEAEERERIIAELETAVANVRTLSGLLPICATCKKIRNDQGYWTQIESYLHARADVQFTHGICPECAAREYAKMGISPSDPD